MIVFIAVSPASLCFHLYSCIIPVHMTHTFLFMYHTRTHYTEIFIHLSYLCTLHRHFYSCIIPEHMTLTFLFMYHSRTHDAYIFVESLLKYRAYVVISDLPEFISLMELNIVANQRSISGSIKCVELIWGEGYPYQCQMNPDFVFLSDCIYYKEVCIVLLFYMLSALCYYYKCILL